MRSEGLGAAGMPPAARMRSFSVSHCWKSVSWSRSPKLAAARSREWMTAFNSAISSSTSRARRDLPDRARLDGHVFAFEDAFEHGDGVPGDLQDGGELGEGAVQLDAGLADGGDVALAEELLGPAQVGIHDIRDEAVRIGAL